MNFDTYNELQKRLDKVSTALNSVYEYSKRTDKGISDDTSNEVNSIIQRVHILKRGIGRELTC